MLGVLALLGAAPPPPLDIAIRGGTVYPGEAAPFVAYNAAGSEVGRVSVNQQANGARWNALGTFNFTAGWNRVQLSRWTTAGSIVVADAVRVR